MEKLREHGEVSQSELSREIHRHMISGKEYTRKKVNTVAIERFSYTNMVYTQMFINYLHSKELFKLKFFDKAGLKIPTDSTRCYGHAPKGQRCVEIRRYA